MTTQKTTELNFDDPTPIEVPVKIAGKAYTLREATGKTAVKYRNEMLNRTTLGADGKPTNVRNMADIEPLLVSMTLFDDMSRPVPIGIIEGWSSRVQKALYERVREISELNEAGDTLEDLEKQYAELGEKIAKLKAEDAAKNGQGGLTVGSD